MKRKCKPLEERFWGNVDKTPGQGPDGTCWLWQKRLDRYGYGQIQMSQPKRYRTTTHRMAWIITHGEIPKGMSVLHKCDNRACCNPDHLFLGTPYDNAHDMFDKGRGTIQRKLNEEQVLELIRRYRAGEKSAALAKEYGISVDHVSRLSRGGRWKRVQSKLG